MAMLRDVRFIPAEHDPVDADVAPSEAYWSLDSGSGEYQLASGDKAHEAVAFNSDQGSGEYLLDDAIAEEDRVMYLVGTEVDT